MKRSVGDADGHKAPYRYIWYEFSNFTSVLKIWSFYGEQDEQK